jgi:toxin CcdB
MSQFDVYANTDPTTKTRIPYVVALQSDLLDAIENHVVAPLRVKDDKSIVPVVRLNPVLLVNGKQYLLRVQDIATVPRRLLKKPVANLSPQRDEILAALDLLFTGL